MKITEQACLDALVAMGRGGDSGRTLFDVDAATITAAVKTMVGDGRANLIGSAIRNLPHAARPLEFPAARGERLRKLRKEFGPSVEEFCQKYEFEKRTWQRYERDGSIGLTAVYHLVEKIPGVSFDWIFFGAWGNVSDELAEKLEGLDLKNSRGAASSARDDAEAGP